MPGAAPIADDHIILAAFREEATREQAFTQLVCKYQERLYWHIRRMVVVHDDANDVIQNMFIKVWKNLAEFRQEANLYTWLYRIATNEALTWIDQAKRRNIVSIDSGADEEGGGYGEKIEAESGYDANKIEWKLQKAIQALPEKQRAVFNLRYYDEMPYEQMSEVLDTSVGALKASYHHAVKKVEAFVLNN
ncbi:MAG: sigma-70 family RNA polymerase sigma factor [Taibaiella sp.]|nr:sigma-70 family RNA polymerase sigma factor [Taibaiella sp.]